MISTRYKCIFVRVSKAASMSIREALIASKKMFDRGYFGCTHYPITYYRDTYPNLFNKYFKFAFVRNPWGRIYSQYRYQRFNRHFEIANCPFKEWVEKCEEALNTPGKFLFGRNREIFVLHLTNQLDWLTIDGNVAVDFIGRFERLETDFAYVCKQLKLKSARLPHSNKSGHGDNYKTVYDEELCKLIAKWHTRDIEYFGYKF